MPATRASRFCEALAFGMHVLGLTGCLEPLNSHRVKGASLRSFMTKRLLKQREVLKVDWVRRLEDAMQEMDVPDRDK
eukprot:11455138-Karenia_brevis.AAC.1